MSEPRLEEMELVNYRAFAEPARISLAPLTFVLGRNNMGKTSLLRAPRFVSHILSPRAEAPFDLGLDGLPWGEQLTEVCYGDASFFQATLRFSGGSTREVAYQAAQTGHATTPFLDRLRIEGTHEEPLATGRELEWAPLRDRIARRGDLAQVHERIALMTASRGARRRGTEAHGGRTRLGPRGEGLPESMLSAKRSSPSRRRAFDRWLAKLADGAQAEARQMEDGRIVIFVRRGTEPWVPLAGCGSGIGQIMPVIAALTLGSEEARPDLWAIEQPEAELHPAVHPDVAELLIEAATAEGGPRLLVETHSDPLLLRVRAALAEERLQPQQVKLYVVEPHPDVGSRVREIPLDDRGTPGWWPRGLFAEPATEFRRIVDALARRDGRR